MGSKTALITGASSGIGKSYAELLAKEGYDLILVARREELLNKISAEISKSTNRKVTVIVTDLSNHEGLEKFKEKLPENPDIEVFVHAAGFGTRGFVYEIEPELLEQQVFLHNVAATVVTRLVLPGMVKNQKGYLIYISSVAAFISTANYPVYSATKAFLNTFAIGLRDEVLSKGIKVQAVCPGITKTGFMHTNQYKEFDYSFIPDKYWMMPEEVVSESWQYLQKKDKPVLISGKMNRMMIKFLNLPLIGTFTKNRISKNVRKKVSKGEKVNF